MNPAAGAVMATLVAVPLVFDPRSGHPGARPKYVLLLTGAAVAGALWMWDPTARRRAWAGNRLRWPVLGLVAWTAVSAAFNRDHGRIVLTGFPGSYDGLWAAMAFAAVFFVASGFEAAPVRRALTALTLGAGTGVAVFGLAQLLDRLVSPASGWNWARPSITPWTIGSTLGNPNSLGSFLAVLLPLVVVLAILATGRARIALVALGAVMVGQLAITMSRAGLVAAVAGVGLLGVLVRTELRAHSSRILRMLAVAVILAVAMGAGADASGVAKRDARGLIRVGPGSSLDLRLEVWATAWRVGVDHPLVGVGPDVFPLVFEDYESDRFMLLFGPFTIANGAHNVFFNTLANLGGVGLAIFLLLLLTAASVIARGLTRLGPARDATDDCGETRFAARRLLLAGVCGSLAAYLVQASFNPQHVALSLWFWSLVGFGVALSKPREEHAPSYVAGSVRAGAPTSGSP